MINITTIKELMDWVDKELSLGKDFKDDKIDIQKGYSKGLRLTRNKLIELAKKDLERLNKNNLNFDDWDYGISCIKDLEEVIKNG